MQCDSVHCSTVFRQSQKRRYWGTLKLSFCFNPNLTPYPFPPGTPGATGESKAGHLTREGEGKEGDHQDTPHVAHGE